MLLLPQQFQFVVIFLPVFLLMAGIGFRNLWRKLKAPNPIRNDLARLYLWFEKRDLVERANARKEDPAL